jgi:hypothetical protein
MPTSGGAPEQAVACRVAARPAQLLDIFPTPEARAEENAAPASVSADIPQNRSIGHGRARFPPYI